MNGSWTDTQPWSATLELNYEGIWTIHGGRCAIGTVLLVRKNQDIALIRKAAKVGYEFSGKFALPGGIVRGSRGESFAEALERSLFDRVERECGVNGDRLGNVHFMEHGPWPVSGYTAKGKDRRTMILAAEGSVPADCNLADSDGSVDHAGWYALPLPWGDIAPANRMILASTFAGQIPAAEKDAAMVHIESALRSCNGWAADVGLPVLHHPWEF